MTTMVTNAVIHSTREELRSRVPYHVEVPELLLGPLPSNIRTRVWLALAKIAQDGGSRQDGLHAGEGFRLTYQVDGSTRTVTLLGVEERDEPFALA